MSIVCRDCWRQRRGVFQSLVSSIFIQLIFNDCQFLLLASLIISLLSHFYTPWYSIFDQSSVLAVHWTFKASSSNSLLYCQSNSYNVKLIAIPSKILHIVHHFWQVKTDEILLWHLMSVLVQFSFILPA
jgi:hypothetical protein